MLLNFIVVFTLAVFVLNFEVTTRKVHLGGNERKGSVMTSSSLQTCDLTSLSMCRCNASPDSDTFTVDCSISRVKKVPNTYPDHMTHLKLDFNNISIIHNFSFVNNFGNSLENLRYLSLNNNNLTFIEDCAFEGLNRLETLLLYNNNLYSAFQTSTLMFMPLRNSLKVLDIRRNIKDECVKCRKYPGATVKYLSNLNDLYMDGINKKPLDADFTSLGNLRKLVFSGGRGNVAHIDNRTFRSVPNIIELDVSGIGIKFWVNALQYLPHLKVLDLCNNPGMASMESLQNVGSDLNNVQLEKLYMNNTGIRDGIQYFLNQIGEGNGIQMKVLTLDSNLIYDYTKSISKKFPNIEILSLGDNYWNAQSKFFVDFGRMKHLIGLNMSWQQGTSYGTRNRRKRSRQDVWKWKDVNKMHLCQIGIACPLNIPHRLQWVDLSHFGFQLPHVPEMALLTNTSLNYLNMAFTGITAFPFMIFCPAPLHVSPKFQTIDVSGNSIHCINSSIFTNCSMETLENLYLAKNNLGWTGANVCNNHEDNNLAFIKPVMNLKTIDLQENNLNGRISDDVFLNNTKLQNIILAANALVELNISMDQLLELEMLDLGRNNLRCLSESTFRTLENLQRNKKGKSRIKLDLSNNPFVCNCSCLPFYQWIARTKMDLINVENYECKFSDGSTMKLNKLSTILVKLDSWCSTRGAIEVAWSTTILLNALLTVATVTFRYIYSSSTVFVRY